MMKWELKECGWKVEGKARHKGGSVGGMYNGMEVFMEWMNFWHKGLISVVNGLGSGWSSCNGGEKCFGGCCKGVERF